ncbi:MULTISPECIES: cytochrome c [unclassified Herbaspirillum]|uniref:c-type cytochrome n=1 Tax=unclassified Herbaspirillum TaxID=2624150 RepID=UPI001170848F|nr:MULTISPECIES: cytochrome c [unclassified Herbaspirillum]MBB5391862.1 mono/diheme cytochrome c family protein [Herbaspirillum sp. SJZ102]TQK13322.1 mono/diheme cytochrome c family protein [Herbaspirillum sp. SJZ130]TQK15326.1 mono/diheme cytochrome c family protein [Herbaspirillum sp. SJZ106]TWC71224.1 mono/diheme cytochrome c family protein [Herbaspirillum sp. SJZ099]
MIKHYFIAACAAVMTLSAAAASAQNAPADQQLVKRGEYLAKAGDCVACHTAKGGKPFAGGLPMATPIGTVYSSNITPDKEHGIGNYSEDDFDKALRHGIRKDGASLYPAMPYPSYAKVKPADVKALYAYFMNGVQADPTPNRGVDIVWPLSMRWPLSIWRKVFAPAVAVDGADDNSPLMRGKYLVEGLGHCGACHTPRGIGMQEKALTDDSTQFLSGGVVEGYLANNLRGDARDGLGNWSEEDIAVFLKTGRNSHSAAFGGMADVVANSTQYMTDEDLTAIAKYLKSLKPVKEGVAPLAYDDKTHQALRKGSDQSPGAMGFLNNCAACHRSSGKGWTETFPTLAQSATVNADNPASLIKIVLAGGEMPWTHKAPTQFAMPAFGSRLSDQEVAEIVTFIRNSWGNSAGAVSASDVAKVRKELPKQAMEAGPATVAKQ